MQARKLKNKNNRLSALTYWSIIIISLLALAGCQNRTRSIQLNEYGFPESMVGTWIAQLGIGDVPDWQITFESDGTISKINHPIFGLMVIQEGGIYYDGPEPGTFMIATMGPVESEYDPRSGTIKVKVVINDYEMKLPQGSLQGHMYDTFIGPVTKDGKTWETEARNYGWLEGAKEPDIDYIDKNPEKKIFIKSQQKDEETESSQTSDPNTED